MTRLRFILVSFFAAVAALLGLCRKGPLFRAIFATASKPVHPQFGYVFTHRKPGPMEENPVVSPTDFGYYQRTYTIKQKDTPNGPIFQWRTDDGIAMSPVFQCRDSAIFYTGPFAPQV